MSTTQIKDLSEAQAIARDFIETYRLRTNDAVDVARRWFTTGNYSEESRKTLTVENLNSKLASDFLVRKN